MKIKTIKSPYSLSPRKEAERLGAFKGRKPLPFLSEDGDLKWSVILFFLFMFIVLSDSIFTEMGY